MLIRSVHSIIQYHSGVQRQTQIRWNVRPRTPLRFHTKGRGDTWQIKSVGLILDRLDQSTEYLTRSHRKNLPRVDTPNDSCYSPARLILFPFKAIPDRSYQYGKICLRLQTNLVRFKMVTWRATKPDQNEGDKVQDKTIGKRYLAWLYGWNEIRWLRDKATSLNNQKNDWRIVSLWLDRGR